MNYELRTIQGCPNSGPALDLFLQVLAAEGKDARDVRVREARTDVGGGRLGVGQCRETYALKR
ncbi:hypothetical protein J2Y68_001251 [Paenarthrobacter nitroguajacolicus]|nr:hypothetical protein [Paenarthrobacter nitroguajacolicus]